MQDITPIVLIVLLLGLAALMYLFPMFEDFCNTFGERIGFEAKDGKE